MKRSTIQTYIAVTSFLVAVILSFMGFYTPPQGDLTDSNLYLVAQFLLVTTSIFGVSSIVTRHKDSGLAIGQEGN